MLNNSNNKTKNRRCPKCNSGKIRKIIYGDPTSEVMNDPNKITLGCIIIENEYGDPTPYYGCLNCNHKFDKVR